MENAGWRAAFEVRDPDQRKQICSTLDTRSYGAKASDELDRGRHRLDRRDHLLGLSNLPEFAEAWPAKLILCRH